MAPATRNGANPADPRPISTPPITRPTAHDASTTMSVCFGPSRSHSQPQPKLAAIATIVNPSRIVFASRSETPSASVVTTLITTITVFTASL